MAANLAATGGLPMAERVTALLRDSLGAPQAHDLVAAAAARAVDSTASRSATRCWTPRTWPTSSPRRGYPPRTSTRP